MEKTSNSNTEFAPECEIRNKLVPTMHWWDRVIDRMHGKTWVIDTHNELKCNASTAVTVVEPLLQFKWKNSSLG